MLAPFLLLLCHFSIIQMQIHLIAIGTRMPEWVNAGYHEYAKRLPPACRLRLHEIAAGKRGKNADIGKILREEGERLLKAVPTGTRVIALERTGRARSTEQLAQALATWLADGRDVAWLVGGPEGLSPPVVAAAEELWSLSPLTLPHPLVRVLLAEQLYRAWSLLHNLPYHRGEG
jgi:23S rRNA (pseudouridine1915-N3)-methyltransferase